MHKLREKVFYELLTTLPTEQDFICNANANKILQYPVVFFIFGRQAMIISASGGQ